MEAYLDNSATTKCAREVVETVVKAMQDDYGNPSSKHMKGVDAEQYIKQAAATIARSLKCQEKELVFTSGGTESNNMAIIGTAMANKRRGNHVIVSSVEHSSVKEPFNFLEEQGFRVTYLPVDAQGRVSIDALREALDSETILVSVMYANNEIGTVEPIEEIGQIVDLMVADLRDRLIAQDMTINLTPAARKHIAEEGTDTSMGARPLRRAIQRLLEDEIAEQILEGRWHAGSVIDVDFVDGKLVFSEGEGEIPAPPKRDSIAREAESLLPQFDLSRAGYSGPGTSSGGAAD